MTEYKLIPLSQGRFAKVSPQDYDKVAALKWYFDGKYAAKNPRLPTLAPGRYRQTKLRMHRFILGVAPGVHVDHVDGDGLNNTRANLRACTHAQNLRNRAAVRTTGRTSEFKGVYFDKARGTWAAGIKVDGRHGHLGRFETEAAAALAYNAAAERLHGSFARLNNVRSAE